MKTRKFFGLVLTLALLATLGVIVGILAATGAASSRAQQAILVDHNCTELAQIPESWIEQVKQNIKVYYGHTSHGSQLTNGLEMIESEPGSTYSVAMDWYLPDEPGALCIRDAATYDPGDFFPTVPDALSANPEINVVLYAWCGQPGADDWQSLLDNYIAEMETLEQQYPNVTFVYMTGHTQEGDCSGCYRHLFNEALRSYATENDKVLYDFADLDVWHDDDYTSNAYACPGWCSNPGDVTPIEHENWGGGNWDNPCGHTTNESCVNKGKAMWWLLARIAGWGGTTDGGDLSLRGTPANQAIHLDWSVNTTNTLPVTSTWQITYAGPTGDQPSPITGIPNPTRAYTLTGLTNYQWYTVTLHAMLGETSWLSDTVRVMPADRFIYLPLVLKK